jgi:hypothetical protein
MHNTNSVPRFDRHKHMSIGTLDFIMTTKKGLWNIKDLPFHNNIDNMLSGMFDGYDYSQMIIDDPMLDLIKAQDKCLHINIVSICDIVSTYPKLQACKKL